MNVLAFTGHAEIIRKLKALCKERGDKLKVIKSLENPLETFMDSSMVMGSSPWFAPSYHAVVADLPFFEILQKLNKGQLNHRFFLYPVLLVLNDFSPESLSFTKGAEVFAVIQRDASPEEYALRLELLAQSFNYIRQMREWAFRDMLTGLNNRRTFGDFLTVYFRAFAQYKVPFCLAVIDLDHFKNINDTYGHPKGDEVLKNLAQIMRANTRKTDVLSRIGGEEFAIIFPDTTLPFALKVLQRIAKNISSHKDPDGARTSLSAGLVESAPIHNSKDSIFLEADQLLYRAKNEGRNRICIPEP